MSKNKSTHNTHESHNSHENDLNSTADNEKIKIEWSIENEDILVEWCDVAQCYRWLHMRSNRKYNRMHMYFTIPTITLSTITGTASFAQASLPQDYQAWASMAIGAINIFIGIITTIQQYLKVSELNEAHRVSALSWDKYARNIRIELAKAPSERVDAKTFLKICRQEFDRLMETSPAIPAGIIIDFKNTFKGSDGSTQREIYNNLRKPDILDIIVTSDLNRHRWYKDQVNEAQKIHTVEKLRQYSCESDDTYFGFKNLIGNNSAGRRKSMDSVNSNLMNLGSKRSTPSHAVERNSNHGNPEKFFQEMQFNNDEPYTSPIVSSKNSSLTNDIHMHLEINSADSSREDVENQNTFINND